MKIHEAITAVMVDVGAVDKGGNNKMQGFKFRGIDQVVNNVSPSLKKFGVVIAPIASEATYVERTNQKGNAVIDSRVRVTYRWIGPENDFLDVTVVAEARDLADKATAKAMSVAFRTCIIQTLSLPTDEPDPDEDYQEANGADMDVLKVIVSAIQADAKAANLSMDRVAELAAQAGIKGRISECRSEDNLKKLSDLVRLENG